MFSVSCVSSGVIVAVFGFGVVFRNPVQRLAAILKPSSTRMAIPIRPMSEPLAPPTEAMTLYTVGFAAVEFD